MYIAIRQTVQGFEITGPSRDTGDTLRRHYIGYSRRGALKAWRQEAGQVGRHIPTFDY